VEAAEAEAANEIARTTELTEKIEAERALLAKAKTETATAEADKEKSEE